MSGPSEVRIGSVLEEFPGRSFNHLVRGWYLQQGTLLRDKGRSGGPGQITIAKAKNITGDRLYYGDCVALEGLAIDDTDNPNQHYNRPLLKAQKHTASLHHAVMGVSLKTVEEDQPGPFINAGPAWIQCRFTDASHHFAKLEEDQSTFSPVAIASDTGYQILATAEDIPDPEYLPATIWTLVFLGGMSPAAGGDVVIALIDDDIEGATEEDPPVEQENSDPTADALALFCFEPRSVTLKYYRDAVEGDPGYEEGKTKLILATKEVDDEYASEGTETEYETKTFLYFDGRAIELDEYDRSDYPDYPESDPWPPPDLPEGFLKHRLRVQAKPDSQGRYWLDVAACELLPPPPLPEEST